MAIDIDAFLEKFNTENKEQLDKKEETIDLDFQEEVESKLVKVTDKSKSANFELLNKLYLEIKKFDIDLPNKFLGIEKQGDITLKEIGKRYSKAYLNNLRSRFEYVLGQINEKFDECDLNLKQNNYLKLLVLIDDLHKQVNLIPKEFIEEKNNVEIKIIEFENVLINSINEYKDKYILTKKQKINQKASILTKKLKDNNIEVIRNSLGEFKLELESISKLFYIHFLEEKKKFLEFEKKTVLHLNKLERNNFEEIEKIVYETFDKFHKAYLNKELNNVVLIYDELLEHFSKLPNIFIEKKIKIYEEITTLYTSINNLVINDNINLFLESYNSSKIIADIREYLRHGDNLNKINYENLKLLEKKIQKIPDRFLDEKEDLRNQINKYTKIIESKIKKKQIQNKKIEEKNNLIVDIKKSVAEEKKIEQKIEKDNDDKKISLKNRQVLKEINSLYLKLKIANKKDEIEFLYNEISLKLKDANVSRNEFLKIKTQVEKVLEKKQDISKKLETEKKVISFNNNKIKGKNEELLKEINNLCKKMQDSNNKEELKKNYQKAVFYSNILTIDEKSKNNIKKKVKDLIMSKNFN